MVRAVLLLQLLSLVVLSANAFITYNFHQPINFQTKFPSWKDESAPTKKSIIVEAPYAFTEDLPSAFEVFGNAPWQYRNYFPQMRGETKL
ncbi:hypothetical protein QR680_013005 [Steinernema hermaphroditum]|uniref:Uncharacterized protein n=1 Tax=Steinernema hermaphroditum TaxID=289476 RepID=A0AA39I5P4_9BILA|nr:hypothetical protein QR680_013005 [Steinernema hermaphroditum]